MKYSNEEAFFAILQKGKSIERARRARRKTRLLSAAVILLFSALTAVIAILPGHSAQSAQGSVYGSFLLSMEVGGYVLVGVLAFVLGVAITLLCVYLSRDKNRKQKESENVNNTED